MMSRSDDLLTRLAAADPVPATEPATAEEEREAALLLERVLALPYEEPAAPRRVRRVARRPVAALALALALVVALVGLWPSERTPGLGQRAYAAVTAPELFFHVVARATSVMPDLDAAPGARSSATGATRWEAWYDNRRPAYHAVSEALRDGRRPRLEFESAGGGNGTTTRFGDDPSSRVVAKDSDVFPERFDPTADAKRIMRAPGVRDGGAVIVDGRRARRLVLDRPDAPAAGPAPRVVDVTESLLVDAGTLYPIAYREQGFFVRDGVRERYALVLRYTTFETLPRTPQTLRLLQMGARPRP
jgi:hypothetical protein